MAELKEGVGAVARNRGWEGDGPGAGAGAGAGAGVGGLGSRTIYAAMGTRTVSVLRKGPGGGTVRFAE